MSAMSSAPSDPPSNPVKEIVQPFIDLFGAQRAIHGINWPYLIEGIAYWGILGYLLFYFNNYVKLGDIWSGRMVGVLTMGITIAMFFFGTLADRWGVRKALLVAFVLMFAGRLVISLGPTLGVPGGSLSSPLNLMVLFGILLIVSGYGMYQPAAYASVRQFTSEKEAGPAYAMLYALMNLGGWIPTWFTGLRHRFGIVGVYWILTAVTVIAFVLTLGILSPKTVQDAIARAKAERDREKAAKGDDEAKGEGEAKADEPKQPFSLLSWIKNHPLADPKFSFFIFSLIPVQTLFAHNWLTLPVYVNRGFRETWPWISKNFEKAVNFNPLLIFIMVPVVTEVTKKRNVYNMMILGTLIMAAPTFLLSLGAKPWTLVSYLVIMTIGEAMWQPRFLQYAAEIAPEGRTGAYMGVAQFPWFMTKLIVPLYSGWFIAKYCPKEGAMQTETMWLTYALIAMSSTVMLVLAKGWLGKDFKTKAE